MSTVTIETLTVGRTNISAKRIESLTIAIGLGADEATLIELRDAEHLSRTATVRLPAHRLEGMSRGRGWARMGRGDSAVWGERVDGGYRVGPGRWTVGGNDGFNRKGSNEYTARHIAVGDQTWTIAASV